MGSPSLYAPLQREQILGTMWGGIEDFKDFMEAYEDSSHPDHKEKIQWVGLSWNPVPDKKLIILAARKICLF